MKRILIALGLLASFAIANETHAQYVTLRAPTVGVPVVGVPVAGVPVAGVPVAPPAYRYSAYRYSYPYTPAPVVVQQPVIAPVTPVPVMRRPAYMYYSPYGGTELRVPGQPVANTLRAIIP